MLRSVHVTRGLSYPLTAALTAVQERGTMASPGQKVVLITGCSSGIGLRMAVMLAKDEQKRFHGRFAPG